MQYIYVMDYRSGEVHIYHTEKMDSEEIEKFIRVKGHAIPACDYMVTEHLKLHVH
jgi:hypothetical protein